VERLPLFGFDFGPNRLGSETGINSRSRFASRSFGDLPALFLWLNADEARDHLPASVHTLMHFFIWSRVMIPSIV
jgi:hypothetical protein